MSVYTLCSLLEFVQLMSVENTGLERFGVHWVCCMLIYYSCVPMAQEIQLKESLSIWDGSLGNIQPA
jgi:hypothetical protein